MQKGKNDNQHQKTEEQQTPGVKRIPIVVNHPGVVTRLRHRLGSFLLVSMAMLFSTVTFAAQSSDTVVTGNLERWLATDVLPPLAKLLSNHPRFKGETIRVAGLTDGRPHAVSDQLTQALAKELTHGLLRTSGVRIAWQEQVDTGCSLPRELPYLLGIEVSRKGARGYQVTLAMIDVEESVWVAGVNYRYDGRLSNAQQKAVATRVTTAAAGSVTSPVRLSRHDLIARQLAGQIDCRGIDGDLFVDQRVQVGQPVLAPILVQLRRQLAQRARFTLVNDASSADWVMRLVLERIEGAGHELVAILSSSTDVKKDSASAAADTNDLSQQRLAALFVAPTAAELAQLNRGTSAPSNAGEPAQAALAAPTRPESLSAPPVPRGVISPPVENYIASLQEVRPEPESRCRRRGSNCKEVEVRLNEPSYLVLFHTAHDGLSGQVSVGRCEREFELTKPGVRRYRIGLKNHQAGVYVIATPELEVAQQLQRQLASGDTRCLPGKVDDGWLTTTRGLLMDLDQRMDWRVVRIGRVVGSKGSTPAPRVAQRGRLE